MGPYLIFDKSFLESLTIQESVWLDNFFWSNITPIFYVEALADLERTHNRGKSDRAPEDIVRDIAVKTPLLEFVPALHHQQLVIGDLMGEKVEMTDHHRPYVAGGEYKKSSDGKVSIDYRQFPESAALERWRRYEFREIEREVAGFWRRALESSNFDTMIALVKNELPQGISFSNIKDVKKYTDGVIRSRYNQFIYFAFALLDIPEKYRGKILKRWSNTRPMPFNEFAPYAAYVLSVNIFFYLCLDKSFISKDRPSNMVDVSYLYYLPFCSVFVSGDNLHSRIVPLFIDQEQTFVQGNELKEDLRKLNAYYETLPDNIKALGTTIFAMYPPEDQDTLVGRLHDKYLKPWRENAKAHKAKLFEPIPQDKDLLKKLHEKKSPYIGPPISSDQVDSMTISRKVLASRGGWRILPVGIEGKEKA